MIFMLFDNAQNMQIEVVNNTKLLSNSASIFSRWIAEEGLYEDYNMIYVGF